MRARAFALASFALLLSAAIPSHGLQDSRVWLPKSYQSLYLKLVKAAQSAESIDRCVEVLEATIDLAQSQPEHPIYRILCRQESGLSYNEMVDGLSFRTLTTPQIYEDEMSEQELAALYAKRAAEKDRRRLVYWQMCEPVVEQRTRFMQSLAWQADMPPKASEMTDETAYFEVPFSAKSPSGDHLKYTVTCRVDAEGGVVAEVIPRKALD